jgi:hypothetical protein
LAIEGRGLTRTVYAREPETLLESVAITVNGYDAGLVTDGAVPVSWPPDVRLSHAGKFVALNAMDPEPPLALMVCEYARPEVVAGKVDGAIVIAGFTSRENWWESEAVALSTTFTPNTEVVGEATASGIPLTTPAALSDMPGGSAPLTRLHENGDVPPVALSVRVQRVPAVHGDREAVLITRAELIVRSKLRVPVSFTGSVAVTLA